MTVSVVGLGKLGSAFAAAVASTGHDVLGTDIDEEIIADINDGIAPFPEPGLQEYFDEYGNRIRATVEPQRAVKESTISFIFVPTPSEDDGSFDNSYIYATLAEMSAALPKSNTNHSIVIGSTVSPTSSADFEAYLESEIGTDCGDGWELCYNPCYIAQGTIIRDFLQPDILTIGQSHDAAGRSLEEFWTDVIESDPTVLRTNYINAELTKIVFNVYSTMKISFANVMAMLTGQHQGADVDQIMNTIKKDERIGGEKLFTGGLGYGGPCLPRDNAAFEAFADFPDNLNIGERVQHINRTVPKSVSQSIRAQTGDGDTIGILGLSYKPDTHITMESQALEIMRSIQRRGYDVEAYDPMAEESTCESITDLLDASDTVAILTPWSEFDDIDTSDLREKTVIDVWRLHYPDLSDLPTYYAWGVDIPNAYPDPETSKPKPGRDTV